MFGGGGFAIQNMILICIWVSKSLKPYLKPGVEYRIELKWLFSIIDL